ncbi:MAG: prepilin-type N-terminal cleavage/methylation domain-containing protein [Kofleriaceae bacterium]|nr:MAG: prepilin-type N-terminal cleavage/methylation domain-containing protein [Kofleriaceae bacterium]MBZ0231110.1 prepilin-type N-terminal cleavage/methylation domain-containing protein [Kofleriaceae bacterium]
MFRTAAANRRRSRLRQLGMTLLEIMIVLAILALVMGLLVGPQVMKLFSEGKGDIARAGVKKLAYESYPQWASRPANTGKCPTIQQLAEYGGSVKDPFGEEYVIKCNDLPAGAVGIAVYSKGEDKREGTGDDIKSWDQQ